MNTVLLSSFADAVPEPICGILIASVWYEGGRWRSNMSLRVAVRSKLYHFTASAAVQEAISNRCGQFRALTPTAGPVRPPETLHVRTSADNCRANLRLHARRIFHRAFAESLIFRDLWLPYRGLGWRSGCVIKGQLQCPGTSELIDRWPKHRVNALVQGIW